MCLSLPPCYFLLSFLCIYMYLFLPPCYFLFSFFFLFTFLSLPSRELKVTFAVKRKHKVSPSHNFATLCKLCKYFVYVLVSLFLCPLRSLSIYLFTPLFIRSRHFYTCLRLPCLTSPLRDRPPRLGVSWAAPDEDGSIEVLGRRP